MVNFWLNLGFEVARLLIPVLIGGLLFRRFVSPGINEAILSVEEGVMKITNVAKLAGVKSQEYATSKGIEKVVAADLIKQNVPELEALRLVLSPDTWDQIEEAIEDNPEAVLQLYEKYGHLLKQGGADAPKPFDF